MAAPTLTLTADKQTYQVGETVTLTAVYADPDARDVVITGTAIDSAGNESPATVTIHVSDPVDVTVSDDGGRTWTKVSDTGSTAVFTATA